MNISCRNFVAVVGDEVAEQMVKAAGSLEALSVMVPGDIKKLGAAEVLQESSKHRLLHAGYLMYAPILDHCDRFTAEGEPSEFHSEERKKGIQQLASKVRLVVNMDVTGGSPDGGYGREVAEELRAKFLVIGQKPNEKSEVVKALPVPKHIAELKDPRAGRRVQRLRQKYGSTELEKRAQRVELGVSVEDQHERLLESRVVKADEAKRKESARKAQEAQSGGGGAGGDTGSSGVVGGKRLRDGKPLPEAATASVYDDLLTIVL